MKINRRQLRKLISEASSFRAERQQVQTISEVTEPSVSNEDLLAEINGNNSLLLQILEKVKLIAADLDRQSPEG